MASLSQAMADVDAWNALTVEQRAEFLGKNQWTMFNHFAAMLSPEEVKTLQEHPEFQPLRIATTRAVRGDQDELRRATDLISQAVYKLRG